MSDLSTTRDEREYAEWLLREVKADGSARSLVAQRVKYVAFESRSNGTGRGPREPRMVEFVQYQGTCIHLGPELPGELDRVLEGEILEGIEIPSNLTPYAFFLQELRNSA